MPTVSRIGPKLAYCTVVAGSLLYLCAARDTVAQEQARDFSPSQQTAATSTAKSAAAKTAALQAPAETGSELVPPLPESSPASSAAPARSKADARNVRLIDADEPEKLATAFLEQNQKIAETHVKTLREEAATLRARLLKVEAGVKRWERLLEALKQSEVVWGAGSAPASFSSNWEYFFQPFQSEIPPPEGSPALEGKKIVILCNASVAAVAEYPSLERDVPRILAEILRKKVKKITIVEPDKISTWVEAHPRYTEPADAARNFGADVAIFLEVEQFQSQSPGDLNMLHGDSKVHIQVFELEYPKNSKNQPNKDQPKEALNVYDAYVESTFPNRGPLPIDSGSSRNAFKQTFLKIVVKEISWHFVPHREEDSI